MTARPGETFWRCAHCGARRVDMNRDEETTTMAKKQKTNGKAVEERELRREELAIVHWLYVKGEFRRLGLVSKPTVRLVMIARNEAHVLARSLGSVRSLIDSYTIVLNDTTDNSEEVIRATLAGLPGEVLTRPWVNYAANRNEALELAEPHADYLLMIDADDAIEAPSGLPPLVVDAYEVEVRYDAWTYQRVHLFRSSLHLRYEGAVHETLPYVDAVPLPGVILRIHGGGATHSDPEKYRKHAELLKAELNTRTTFYLAQSYKDAGMKEEAMATYRTRVALGGNVQEVFVSWMEIGRHTQNPEAWLRALSVCPERAVEPLCELAMFFNWRDAKATAFLFASSIFKHPAAPLPVVPTSLFVDRTAYEWRLLLEYAVAAYYVPGEMETSRLAFERLLTIVPPDQVDLIKRNLALWPPRDAAGPTLEVSEAEVDELDFDRVHRFAVVIPSVPGYPHTEAFREVAETVFHGLRSLGRDVVMATTCPTDRRSIVFGSNVLHAHTTFPKIPTDAILYNLEQCDAPIAATLLPLFAKHEVWDYSARNVAFWKARGIRAKLVPIGYAPEMTRIVHAKVKDIDVLFYGSLNARRGFILTGLQNRGLKVHHVAVYGADRDAFIARSKVVLNLHYYEPGIFEAARVLYLLANEVCVVSEVGIDDEPFHFAVYSAKYDELVDACVSCARDDYFRKQQAQRGFELFSQIDERDILREALGE